jgi:hypothetical protein
MTIRPNQSARTFARNAAFALVAGATALGGIAAPAFAQRDPASVSLIAVSKVQPNDRVRAVLEQGHTLYGENKVQEAQGKWPDFRTDFPDARVHLILHLLPVFLRVITPPRTLIRLFHEVSSACPPRALKR